MVAAEHNCQMAAAAESPASAAASSAVVNNHLMMVEIVAVVMTVDLKDIPASDFSPKIIRIVTTKDSIHYYKPTMQ